jgi:hypothetical protein
MKRLLFGRNSEWNRASDCRAAAVLTSAQLGETHDGIRDAWDKFAVTASGGEEGEEEQVLTLPEAAILSLWATANCPTAPYASLLLATEVRLQHLLCNFPAIATIEGEDTLNAIMSLLVGDEALQIFAEDMYKRAELGWTSDEQARVTRLLIEQHVAVQFKQFQNHYLARLKPPSGAAAKTSHATVASISAELGRGSGAAAGAGAARP